MYKCIWDVTIVPKGAQKIMALIFSLKISQNNFYVDMRCDELVST